MPERTRDISKFKDVQYHEYADIDTFLQIEIKEGLNSLQQGDSWFDFLYENRDSEVTLVTFTAAMPESATTFPIFSSRKIAEQLNVNFLAFADPSAAGLNALPTFWHLGNPEIDAQRLIPAVVSKIQSKTESNLLFFGASAGGFAALNYSRFFPDSAALVLNPRVCLLHHPKRLPRYVPINFPGNDPTSTIRSLPHDQSRLYASELRNQVFYIQNTQDENYKRHHYAHFKKATANQSNVTFITGEWGEGHVVPPRDIYIKRMRDLVSSAPDWRILKDEEIIDVDIESEIDFSDDTVLPDSIPKNLQKYLRSIKTQVSEAEYNSILENSIKVIEEEKITLNRRNGQVKEIVNDPR